MALRISTGLSNRMLGITTEKIVNGDFEAAIGAEWTPVGAATITKEAGTGRSGTDAGLVGNVAGAGDVYQDVTVKADRPYLIRVYTQRVGAGNTGAIEVGISGNTTKYGNITGLDEASYTEHTFYFEPVTADTTIRLTLVAETSGQSYRFDDIDFNSLAHSFQKLFNKGFIEIYTGTQPASPDDAPTGTKLVTIYSDGSAVGISFDDAASGTLTKAAAETWSGTAVDTGTAGWFRLIGPGDGGGSSTTDERLDGAVATSGAELNLSSTAIVSAAVQTISTFSLTLSTA